MGKSQLFTTIVLLNYFSSYNGFFYDLLNSNLWGYNYCIPDVFYSGTLYNMLGRNIFYMKCN